MDVGFIGLGHMGHPMALRLLQAGHRVLAYNRTTRRAEELVAEGATLARTVEEACRAPVVITMLSDDAAVATVACEHMVGAMAPGTIHLSMSTISPAAATRLAEAFAMLRKTGVDPARSLEVLTSTIFPAPVYKNYGTQILQEKFEPGFKLPLGLKDIRLVLATAEAAQAPMPTASLLHDQYLSAMARGYQDLDWSALGKVVADNAGLGPEGRAKGSEGPRGL